MTEMVGREAEALMTWPGILAALEAGHRLPRAEIADLFVPDRDVMLNRAAWIDGLGSLVKVATVCPGKGGGTAHRQRGGGAV